MIAALFFVLSVIVAVILFFVLVYAWGQLQFKELEDFSAGDEPTTVTRLPEIDIPLDKEEEESDE